MQHSFFSITYYEYWYNMDGYHEDLSFISYIDTFVKLVFHTDRVPDTYIVCMQGWDVFCVDENTNIITRNSYPIYAVFFAIACGIGFE